MPSFLNTLSSGIAAAFRSSGKRTPDIQQFSDRKFLREVYLPAFGQSSGRILWVGCRKYTAGYYALLEQAGAEVWTTDIESRLARWGRKGRHRTGDICEADRLFADTTFDAVLCNGVLGYGVDSVGQQTQALEALSRILIPGGRLLIGWNTDKISDPVAAGLTSSWFSPVRFAGQSSRVRFDDSTHVYDCLSRNP